MQKIKTFCAFEIIFRRKYVVKNIPEGGGADDRSQLVSGGSFAYV